jgi:hypothetical protein
MMDQKLKDLLDRAEDWPPEARDELIKAAKGIEKRLAKTPADRPKSDIPAPRGIEQKPQPTLLGVLMSAPKTGSVLAPKRGIRVRVRPPVTFD